MVFAESMKCVDKICENLKLANIKSLPYYSELGVTERTTTL